MVACQGCDRGERETSYLFEAFEFWTKSKCKTKIKKYIKQIIITKEIKQMKLKNSKQKTEKNMTGIIPLPSLR